MAVAKKLSIIIGILTGYTLLLSASSGQESGNLAHSRFSSKESINKNMFQPILGEGIKMSTIDGSREFDTRHSCPSSKSALAITFLPSSGGEYRLLIKQDSDFDGTYDYVYDTNTIGGAISGVCTNGIVSCASGSWSGCKTYYWDTNNLKIALVSASDKSKAGVCSCTNSSCNQTFGSHIYDPIGGGVMATIMSANPKIILGKTTFSQADRTYYIYAQDKTDCSSIASSSYDNYGDKSPTAYYHAQSYPHKSVTDIELEQGGDDKSLYSLITAQADSSNTHASDLSKSKNTLASVNMQGSTLYYKDFNNKTNDVVLPEGEKCPVKMCSVKRAAKDTSSFADGTNRGQINSSINETVHKKCENGICPLEAGEILIEGCGCEHGFDGANKAIATLGAIEEATSDLICGAN